MKSFAVIVPTLNPGPGWLDWLSAFNEQAVKPSRAVIVDSGSTGHEIEASRRYGFEILRIPKAEFNHGATRQKAAQYIQNDCELVVFLTQDAILAEASAVAELLAAFDDANVAAAYGRQLPHKNAKPFGAHARLFNYSSISTCKTREMIPELGFKTCFISNSFAAYRVSDLLTVGGFPDNVILGEDASVAGRLVMAGKKIAYVAEACVYHSHDYSIMEEFHRYFDTGVFHAQQPWIAANFGGASGEGKKFVISELKYLVTHAPYLLPLALLRTFMKLLGYRLGRAYSRMPSSWVVAFSMHKGFWRTPGKDQ